MENVIKKCVVCGEKPRAKYSVCCNDCNGMTFVSTLKPILDTDLVIDYPSIENGSSGLLIASVLDLIEEDCFNGENHIAIFDKENDFFEKNLKEFFKCFEVDGFSKEQNEEIRKEINYWIDDSKGELASVFFDTVTENIFSKQRNATQEDSITDCQNIIASFAETHKPPHVSWEKVVDSLSNDAEFSEAYDGIRRAEIASRERAHKVIVK